MLSTANPQAQSIQFEKTSQPKRKPDSSSLGFGRHFTDHLFQVRFKRGQGWLDPIVTPYKSLSLDPAASSLHYGQALFEGMKAFRQADDGVSLFRPDFNWRRLRAGAERLCMEAPPAELMQAGLEALIRAEKDWVPREPGTALYIRPTLIATEPFLGVRASDEYLFYIILSPVGSYYAEGRDPIRIWIETEYIRAAPGGLGATKAAANYANSLKAAADAKRQGFAQVLWLDVSRSSVEEVGTMNVFFVLKGEVVTPALDGTILAGGTRDTVLTLLRQRGVQVSERKVSLAELKSAAADGTLTEAWGTGTAAVISPISEFGGREMHLTVGDGKWGPLATSLYREISDLQRGVVPDRLGWNVRVPL